MVNFIPFTTQQFKNIDYLRSYWWSSDMLRLSDRSIKQTHFYIV